MSAKRISEETKKKIVALYKGGFSIYRISKDLGVATNTVKKWVVNAGVDLRKTKHDYSDNRKRKLDPDEVKNLYCEQNKSLSEIAEAFGVHKQTVKVCVKSMGIELLDTKNTPKGGFSSEEKKEIIKLYSEEHRGAKHIGSIFNRSDFSITYWLNKWEVPKVSKSDLQKKLREVHGPTKGFSGKKHSEESKKQISDSGVEAWNKEDRLPVIGKSRTFNTKAGKILGSYEVAYLQRLIDAGEPLPIPNRKKFKTPSGSYVPDFDFGDRFIEIKSEFTLQVCKGEMPKGDGSYSDNQWIKIQWVNENVKPVEVIVIEKDEAFNLFVKAINSKFVLDKVEIHKRQYKIINT